MRKLSLIFLFIPFLSFKADRTRPAHIYKYTIEAPEHWVFRKAITEYIIETGPDTIYLSTNYRISPRYELLMYMLPMNGTDTFAIPENAKWKRYNDSLVTLFPEIIANKDTVFNGKDSIEFHANFPAYNRSARMDVSVKHGRLYVFQITTSKISPTSARKILAIFSGMQKTS